MRCSLLVLSTYLDSELDAARRGELEAHLVGCERCRSGLSFLGEEVERISTLAPVHVPDHSVHALFEELGLLGPADPLPYRATPQVTAGTAADLPPWLVARTAGKALPWSPHEGTVPGPAPPASGDTSRSGQVQDDQPVPPMADTDAASPGRAAAG